MNKEVEIYLGKYPDEIRAVYNSLRSALYECGVDGVEEKMWAKLPTYYFGDNFVRLVPFKDHINIEARAIKQYADLLVGYKLTPKYMLQIYVNQTMPVELLREIFYKTLKTNI